MPESESETEEASEESKEETEEEETEEEPTPSEESEKDEDSPDSEEDTGPLPEDRKENRRKDKAVRHSCTHSMDRIQEGPDDFEEIQEGDTLYKDFSFPIQDAIRWDDKPHADDEGMKRHEDVIEWKRVRNEWKPSEGFSLWGPTGEPSLHDIRQG